jgi:hypothetical protein
MFVVTTLIAIWLGWQMKFVRERQEALLFYRERAPSYFRTFPFADNVGRQITAIPFWRKWMGDESYATINIDLGCVEGPDPAERRRIANLFPEALIYIVWTEMRDGRECGYMHRVTPKVARSPTTTPP